MMSGRSSGPAAPGLREVGRTHSGLRKPPVREEVSDSSEDDDDDEEDANQDRFAKEMRAVVFLRMVMLATLLAASIVAGVLTYSNVRSFERHEFLQRYQSSMIKLGTGFQNGVSIKVWAAQTLSALYTSRYGPQSAWPNATMPDFQEQAEGQLRLAHGRAISFNPVITAKNRKEFEAHAADNAYIMGAEQLTVRQEGQRIVADGIFQVRDGERQDDPGIAPGSRYETTMVPVWSIAPIVSNEAAVMFNLHSEKNRQRALDDMIFYKVPTLTAILQLVQDDEPRPSSILFFPVFDSFDKDKVVGSISVVFSWDVVFAELVPDYVEGLIGVLETSIGQAYTYSISGGGVTFLGEGDQHDTAYEDLGHRFDANLRDSDSTLGIVDNLITYSMRIYPSKRLEDGLFTKRPAIYTAVVVLIFFFTSAVFLLYDFFFQHRQNVVVKAATRTSKIVDSLFPAIVRNRMFKTEAEREKELQERKNRSKARRSCRPQSNTVISETPASRLKRFFNIVPTTDKQGFDFSAAFGTEAPIADMFPETTILFADIAGFTAWSASREPHEVFQLLETLYKEFDHAAKKMGVFKVETIGDCYVAVAGLPEPQEDHAVRMALFAMECSRKTREVTHLLAGLLGESTKELRVRSGLHSGKVTAGVLRGQKSRFQLFGDTMNTASRMESTGRADRIQMSEDTAELLIAAGKQSWLTQREDRVIAKGKGEMKTYWLSAGHSLPELVGGKGKRYSISSRASYGSSASRGQSPDARAGESHDSQFPSGVMPVVAVEVEDDTYLPIKEEDALEENYVENESNPAGDDKV